MEYIDNLFITDDSYSDHELEAPLGWSSTCFDQTVNYYIECNSINAKNEEKINKFNTQKDFS